MVDDPDQQHAHEPAPSAFDQDVMVPLVDEPGTVRVPFMTPFDEIGSAPAIIDIVVCIEAQPTAAQLEALREHIRAWRP